MTMLLDDNVFERDIIVIGLRFHARIALWASGIHTVYQLIILSEKEIKAIKGIGKVYFDDICKKINKYFSANNIDLVFPLSNESITSVISSQRKAKAFLFGFDDEDDLLTEYDDEDDLFPDWDDRWDKL